GARRLLPVQAPVHRRHRRRRAVRRRPVPEGEPAPRHHLPGAVARAAPAPPGAAAARLSRRLSATAAARRRTRAWSIRSAISVTCSGDEGAPPEGRLPRLSSCGPLPAAFPRDREGMAAPGARLAVTPRAYARAPVDGGEADA